MKIGFYLESYKFLHTSLWHSPPLHFSSKLQIVVFDSFSMWFIEEMVEKQNKLELLSF